MEDLVIKYMINKEWEKNKGSSLASELLKITQPLSSEGTLPEKLGSFLINQQIVEELLKEIIVASSAYIKVEIWPSEVELKVNLEDKTYGELITYFKNNVLVFKNKDKVNQSLNEMKKIRNLIIHNILSIESLANIEAEIDKGLSIFKEIFYMLISYYDKICEYLCELDNRVDFSMFSSNK